MQSYEPGLKIYAFSDQLKSYCRDHHDELAVQWHRIHPEQVLKYKDDPIYGCTSILQWYGSDVVRYEDKDKWIRDLNLVLAVARPKIAVIADVRFPNEAEYIKKEGGYLVKIVRLHKDGTQYISSDRDPNHISETALDDYNKWDFVVEAKDGDHASLKRQSIGVLNAIKSYQAGLYFVDEPNYSDSIMQHINDQADGFAY